MAYEGWRMRCLLESVQFELWHRSQANKGGVPPPNREWEANAFNRGRLKALAERFPHESDADACQRLTKSMELLCKFLRCRSF